MHRLPSNADCTIYNEHGTGTNRVMIKHVLFGVWLQDVKGISQVQGGIESNNSLDLMLTMRDGYLTPQEWDSTPTESLLNGSHYTLKENDRVIQGIDLGAPETLTSPLEVDKHFGSNLHTVTSVIENKLPGGKTHHFRVLAR